MAGIGRTYPAVLSFFLAALSGLAFVCPAGAQSPAPAPGITPEIQIDMGILNDLNPSRSRSPAAQPPGQPAPPPVLTRPGQRLERPSLTGYAPEPGAISAPPSAAPERPAAPPPARQAAPSYAPAPLSPVVMDDPPVRVAPKKQEKARKAAVRAVPPPFPARKPVRTASVPRPSLPPPSREARAAGQDGADIPANVIAAAPAATVAAPATQDVTATGGQPAAGETAAYDEMIDSTPAVEAVAAAPAKAAPLPARRPANLKAKARDHREENKGQRTALNLSRHSAIKPGKGINMPAVPAIPVAAEALPPGVMPGDILPDRAAADEPYVQGDGVSIESVLQQAAAEAAAMPQPARDTLPAVADEVAGGDVYDAPYDASSGADGVARPEQAAPPAADTPRRSLLSALKFWERDRKGPPESRMAEAPLPKTETPAALADAGTAASAAAAGAANAAAPLPVRPEARAMAVAAAAPAAAASLSGARVPRPPADINNYEREFLSLPFVPGTEGVGPESVKSLQASVLPLLKDNPGWRLQIQAFASPGDSGPTGARSVALSRALGIRTWLMDQGIEARRMDVRALGMETDREPMDRADLVFFDPALR